MDQSNRPIVQEDPDPAVTVRGGPSSEDKIIAKQAVRFYECSFCKRGFSNAQALGGHMNIHRKDKASLKPKHQQVAVSIKDQPTSRTTARSSLDITQSTIINPTLLLSSSSPPILTSTKQLPLVLEYGNSTSVTRTHLPWQMEKIGDSSTRRDRTQIGKLYEDDMLRNGFDQDRSTIKNRHDQILEENKGLDQLDLELRLGPHQPINQRSASSSRATIKFF